MRRSTAMWKRQVALPWMQAEGIISLSELNPAGLSFPICSLVTGAESFLSVLLMKLDLKEKEWSGQVKVLASPPPGVPLPWQIFVPLDGHSYFLFFPSYKARGQASHVGLGFQAVCLCLPGSGGSGSFASLRLPCLLCSHLSFLSPPVTPSSSSSFFTSLLLHLLPGTFHPPLPLSFLSFPTPSPSSTLHLSFLLHL